MGWDLIVFKTERDIATDLWVLLPVRCNFIRMKYEYLCVISWYVFEKNQLIIEIDRIHMFTGFYFRQDVPSKSVFRLVNRFLFYVSEWVSEWSEWSGVEWSGVEWSGVRKKNQHFELKLGLSQNYICSRDHLCTSIKIKFDN